MAAIIGKTGTNGVQQTGQTHVQEKTNKVVEKYTITPKQFVGGLLAGAAAFCGIAYAIKKKPAKITELLEQAKNIGSKNSDEIKKAAKKVSGKVQNVADEAQKVSKKATEVVKDTVDDVAKTAGKYKQENIETLDKLGVKFNKGVAEVYGGKFSGDIILKDKNGKNIFLTFKDGKMIEKITPDKKIVNKNGIFIFAEDLKTGTRTRYSLRSGVSDVVKEDFIVHKEGGKIKDIKEKITYFKKDGAKVSEGAFDNDFHALNGYLSLGNDIW